MTNGQPRHPPRLPVFFLFFLSGTFALIYEVAWVRALTLQFGATTLAISTVVSVYMAGLAIGAAIAGKYADKLSRPLAAYGVLELGLALYALASLPLFGLFLPLFSRLGSMAPDSFWIVSGLRFGLSLLALVLPTALMGATLPVLSRYLRLVQWKSAKDTGLLYGLNTVGACAGCLFCGFVLLPKLGLASAILFTALANLALALFAIALDPFKNTSPAEVPPTNISEDFAERPLRTIINCAVFLTGFAALICQVAWTRVLALTIGSSVYAFSSVLGVFLFGLGAGAYLSARLLRRAIQNSARQSADLFYALCVLTGCAVFLTAYVFQFLPQLFLKLFNADAFSGGNAVFWLNHAVCAALLLLPTLLMGTLFPLALGCAAEQASVSPREVGRLYFWNTAGSILGAALCGFWLIPAVGLRNAILTAATLIAWAGILISSCSGIRLFRWRLRYVTIMTVLLWTTAPQWDPQLMTSGVANYAKSYLKEEFTSFSDYLAQKEELLFYRDGLVATITVSQDKDSANKDLYISTNGKIDGSSHFDMQTQRLLAHMPLLLHADPRQAAVIGMGTGSSAGSALLHPLEQLSIIEIEREMVEGSKLFAAHNHDVHNNPRAGIHVTDGRLFLNLNPGRFDVISSEPSNPWIAGVADLFTVDFYRLASRSLKPHGIFGQWVQLYNMEPDSVRTILRSFQTVFPYTYVAVTIIDTDILLLGSIEPIVFDVKDIERRMSRPEVYADLSDSRVKIGSVYDLLARIWLLPDQVSALTASAVLHTDDLPIIAYTAPKSLFLDTRKKNMQMLAGTATGVTSVLKSLPDYGAARLEESYSRFVPKELPAFWH